MHIRVPEAVPRGESVVLGCDYDLESAALYTIKWRREKHNKAVNVLRPHEKLCSTLPDFCLKLRFHTSHVPEDDLVLRIESQKVAPGGRVRANCTTPGSYPGINITWFLNDEEVRKIINGYLYTESGEPEEQTMKLKRTNSQKNSSLGWLMDNFHSLIGLEGNT
ncbi:unnamed protein product [Phaedon cochleariae]|uniref:Ig-like domain-containing protein n=1 Tax=Phaedon cochleariae TaxID=80249 RepID=A0A9N9WXE2_PHACE|nr:unnamed protein product [Phaedon cochleariae]